MEQTSLWGEEFAIKEDDISAILKKARTKKKVEKVSSEKLIKSKSVSIEEKLKIIKEDVYRILGKYVNDTVVIRDYDTLCRYIDAASLNGMIAVDTETNNTLDTIDCDIVGLCLYTAGQKNAYIPISHRHFTVENGKVVLGDRLENQITEAQIKVQLQRLLDDNVKMLFHNAAFDIGVIMSTCGIRLKAYWDTSICAKILNELEQKSLKIQYRLHIDPTQEKYDIEHLFKKMPYSIFDPELFALYAATDSFMTWKLYEYQKKQFDLPENSDLKPLSFGVETPCIDAVVDMQQTGISADVEYAKKISSQYHEKLDEINNKIDEELENLRPLIEEWRLTPEANERTRIYPAKKTKIKDEDIPYKFPLIDEKGKNYKLSGKSPAQQLTDPIQVTSSTQLQILLYDILKVGVVDPSDPRGTGAEILEDLAEKYRICRLILDKREVQILLDTFIDKIPTLIKKRTGKVHAKFNQYGADTGRFSSGEKDPDNPKIKSLNLQNIPAHDKTIRMIFTPSPGYAIIGSDFSAQEPRSTASLANDEEMIRAYDEGKDLYAVIGSICFHCKYEDCLEFHPVTHELQPEGKERRSKAKAILLGITYGMSAKSLADRIGVSLKEAEDIIGNFYKGFKGVKKLTDDSQRMLVEKGYVTDMWGRRRHLPDAQLPDFTVTPIKSDCSNFNPLLGSVEHEDLALKAKIVKYEDALSKTKWKKETDALVLAAKKDGLKVRNNRLFKSRAMRQCLNARIQGTAASMTKLAMAMIHNDKKLQDLGFQLLITVHDEVLGQAPIENSKEAADRLCELMVLAAKEKCSCKFKCDPYIVRDGWYADEAAASILNSYVNYCKTLSKEEALKKVEDKYLMFNKDTIKKICDETFVLNVDSLKYGPDYYKGM